MGAVAAPSVVGCEVFGVGAVEDDGCLCVG